MESASAAFVMKGSEALLKAAVEAALPELGEVELARLAADCLEEREIFAEVIAVHGDHLICSSRLGDVLVPSKLLTFPADAGCLLRAACVLSVGPRVAFRALSASPADEGWRNAGRRRRQRPVPH